MSDKKYGKDIDANGQYDFYTADSISSVDYTPFGMEMVNRYSNAGGFRYGFNGMEKDNEDLGEGNSYEYGFRVYNPRLGRFFTVDPLTKKFPELTPFQFSSNSPIENTDLDGAESLSAIKAGLDRKFKVQITIETAKQKQAEVNWRQLQASWNAPPSQPGPPYLRPTPILTEAENERAETLCKIDLRTQGYNDDGSKSGWMKLAENKTWNRFAGNIALPLVELGSYAGGEGELRAVYKALLSRASVEDKLARYILNPEHPVGGSKARWFEQALGFTRSNSKDLANQIVFDPGKAIQTAVTEHGTKFNQIIPITGANGKTIDVTFSWIKNKDDVVRLVTAIPAKK